MKVREPEINELGEKTWSTDSEPDMCPKCGGIDIEWGDSDIYDDDKEFYGTCQKCGADITSRYSLVFTGNFVVED